MSLSDAEKKAAMQATYYGSKWFDETATLYPKTKADWLKYG
jgi:hypothetical protein